MPSRLPVKPRRTPQQERGERRVAELLAAAAAELAASGYDAATMSAIAERAGAPIGSLYQFFPNKLSITHALCRQYAAETSQIWAEFVPRARELSLKDLVDQLIGATVAFIDSHPALPRLLDVPGTRRTSEAIRSILLECLVKLVTAYCPGAAKKKAERVAAATFAIMKGFHFLYLETPPKERRPVVQEYKAVLLCYWSARLGVTTK
jgi:AcrR family transcriptional regulator